MPEHETLFASVGQRLFRVNTWAQVSGAYVRFADVVLKQGKIPPKCLIVDTRGRVRACVASSGRVWQGDGEKVTGVCFYEPTARQ